MATKKNDSTRNTKTLLTLVEEKARRAPLSGRNRAVLIEMRDEIATVLEHGYKWRIIWQTLSDSKRIKMGYDTFRMHCRAMGLELAPQSYSSRGR